MSLKNFDLEFTFVSSGFAVLKKKTGDDLNKIKDLTNRSFSFKNLFRIIKKKNK